MLSNNSRCNYTCYTHPLQYGDMHVIAMVCCYGDCNHGNSCYDNILIMWLPIKDNTATKRKVE